MTADLWVFLIKAVGVLGGLCVLSGVVQIVWDARHQRAKRKRATRD